MPGKSFLRFLERHRSILEELIVHQERLVVGAIGEARDLFAGFERRIRGHIREEEEEMLPIYDERAGLMHGGDPDLFRMEHRKIERFLDEIRGRLTDLAAGDLRGRIALIEREQMLKEILHHHDLREQNILYPELDRVTDDAEKERIVGRMAGPQ